MIKSILKTLDKKFDALPVDGTISTPKLYTKAFAIGAAEGLIDGFAVLGVITTVVVTTVSIIGLKK